MGCKNFAVIAVGEHAGQGERTPTTVQNVLSCCLVASGSTRGSVVFTLPLRCIIFCKPERVWATGIEGATECMDVLLGSHSLCCCRSAARCRCSCHTPSYMESPPAQPQQLHYGDEVHCQLDCHNMYVVVRVDVLECTSQTLHA